MRVRGTRKARGYRPTVYLCIVSSTIANSRAPRTTGSDGVVTGGRDVGGSGTDESERERKKNNTASGSPNRSEQRPFNGFLGARTNKKGG